MSETKTNEVNILSLEQLQSAIAQPMAIGVRLDNGIIYRMPARRLSPAERDRVGSLTRAIMPPPIPGKPGLYDYDNAEYREKMYRAKRTARAMIVYMGCDWVAKGKPGLTQPNDILAFLETILSEMVIEVLAAGIEVEGVSVMEAANFTSPSGLENN